MKNRPFSTTMSCHGGESTPFSAYFFTHDIIAEKGPLHVQERGSLRRELAFFQQFPEVVFLCLQLGFLLPALVLGPGADEGLKAGLALPGVQQHVAGVENKLGKLLVPRGKG